MDENSSTDRSGLLANTVEIVSAYASNNAISGAEIPGLIEAVFERLGSLDTGDAGPASAPTPAVPIRRSVTEDYVVCLECGRKLKMLKRHLSTDHEMMPEQYRAKWGLTNDYPIVAPAYAQKRRELAVATGLGRKPAPPTQAHAASAGQGGMTIAYRH
jgi:predicted transcriptional regulator